MIECANIYYFRKICRIGGTEQFLYEIAKKYHKTDLVILYDDADFDQLIRLKQLVRCVRRSQNEKYKTKKAFYNFNIDAIGQIEAEEHIFVAHAIYSELGYAPPIDHPKLTKIVAVSKYAEDSIREQMKRQGVDKPVIQCYNPLTLEKPDKILRVISACRLDDKTKGGARTQNLIKALDKYCAKTGKHYLWTIFTNHTELELDSPNVVYMKPRIDVRPYIADADWLVQVSNDMETYCYSINEALGYGTRIVRTPLTVAKELGIPKEAELELKWDSSNADYVAEQMFKTKKKFAFKPLNDSWGSLLEPKPSNYIYSEEKVLVKPLVSYYDLERGENVSPWTPAFRVSVARAKELIRKKKVRVL